MWYGEKGIEDQCDYSTVFCIVKASSINCLHKMWAVTAVCLCIWQSSKQRQTADLKSKQLPLFAFALHYWRPLFLSPFLYRILHVMSASMVCEISCSDESYPLYAWDVGIPSLMLEGGTLRHLFEPNVSVAMVMGCFLGAETTREAVQTPSPQPPQPYNPRRLRPRCYPFPLNLNLFLAG